jgi:GNAT superfamily N-acetyltransferase
MTPSSGPIHPHHAGGPSRVIQGFFPGGKPRIIQASPTPMTPVRPPAPAPLQAGPALAPAPIPPGRPVIGTLQPATRPGQPQRPILPTNRLQARTLRPAVPVRPQPPRPTLPQPRGMHPQAVQPRIAPSQGPVVQRTGNGEAFQLPANRSNFGGAVGQPLPEPVRQNMESFFKTSFADVRVHVGPQASSIGALAFTHGSNLYFAPGQYNPNTAHGQQLLGHELTHVVQQRAGRVKNPFGSGVAVVQDPGMEAEADRMGMRAASSAMLQMKPSPPPRVQPTAASSSVVVSAPVKSVGGGYRITAGPAGQPVGSVMVHPRNGFMIEVTDLKVEQPYRGQGLGGVLMASALRAGQQMGRSRVVLASQDNGSSRLTRWYQQMGFAPAGVNSRGYPELEATIGRVLTGAMQTKLGTRGMAGARPDPRTAASPKGSFRHSSVGASGRSIQPKVLGVVQAMEAPRPPSSDILRKLAEPKVFNCPDVNEQRIIAKKLDALIEDKKTERVGGSSYAIIPVYCVGGIELPGDLDNFDLLLNNVELKPIASDAIPSSCYDAINHDDQLKKGIVRLMLKTLKMAGQIDYIKSARLDPEEWQILVEVHYLYSRGKTESQLHKDTLGETLFVNLNYISENEMLGPEYIVAPPTVEEHEKNIINSLPQRFLDDLKGAREGLPQAPEIGSCIIPPHGFVSFVDELVYHATPLWGHRTIRFTSLPDLLNKLPEGDAFRRNQTKFEANRKMIEDKTTENARKSSIRQLLPSFSNLKLEKIEKPWEALLETLEEMKNNTYGGKTTFDRITLKKCGLDNDLIERLLNMECSERRTVSIPRTGADKTPKKHPTDRMPKIHPIILEEGAKPLERRGKPLTRTMSERAMSKAGLPPPVAGRRSFFRTWVRAVRRK